MGSTQLKRGAVKNVDLANNAVTSGKIRNNAITGADIRESSLSGVASATSAANATNAGNATHANAAAALDRVVYVRQAGSVAAAPDMTNSSVGGASATCPAGSFAVGGGVGVADNSTTSVVDSFPEPGGRAWSVRVDNNDIAGAKSFTVVAVCLAASAAG